MGMEILAIAAAVCMTCGSGLIAVSNLVGGWRQRRLQRHEGELSRNLSRELNQKNRQLQEDLQQKLFAFNGALNERNLAEAERRQKEMLLTQRDTALELQDEMFKHQVQNWERTNFIMNEWPLISSPTIYLNRLKRLYSSKRTPLQIIIPDSLAACTDGLEEFFNTYYSGSGRMPVFYYDQGWKDAMRGKFGNAQMFPLHDVLAGLPTLVPIPRISPAKIFTLQVHYWGIGDFSMPTTVDLMRIDLVEMDLKLIRAAADSLLAAYHGMEEEVADQNAKTRKEELAYASKLKSAGKSDSDIELILRRRFDSAYSRKGIEQELDIKRREILSAVVEVASAAIADVYHLIEHGESPLAPTLPTGTTNTNQLFADVRVLGMLGDVYRGVLESMKDSKDSRIGYPLWCALVAKSFNVSGNKELSSWFKREAIETLKNEYSQDSDIVSAPAAHIEAATILTDKCMIGEDRSDSILVRIAGQTMPEELPRPVAIKTKPKIRI